MMELLKVPKDLIRVLPSKENYLAFALALFYNVYSEFGKNVQTFLRIGV